MSCTSGSCNRSQSYNTCASSIKQFGVANLDRITLTGSDRTSLNWNEISVQEILSIPTLKPDIEHLNAVYVTSEISCVNLIETPFAYKSYERLALASELTAATAAYTLGLTLSLGAVTLAFDNIIAIAPIIPQTAALQIAYNAVVAAGISYGIALTALNTVITTANVTAAALKAALQAVITALVALRAALAALRAAAVALGAAVPTLATLILALTSAIDTIYILIDSIIAQINAVITLIGYTSSFEIISDAENTYLTGRKLIINGSLHQKIIYTANTSGQSVHSAEFCMPFSGFIIPYAKFVGLTYQEGIRVVISVNPITGVVTTGTIDGFNYDPNTPIEADLCQEFCVNSFIEDIFAYPIDSRTIFKNNTLFLQAKVSTTC